MYLSSFLQGKYYRCLKSVRIRSFSVRIFTHSAGKIRTRKLQKRALFTHCIETFGAVLEKKTGDAIKKIRSL